MWNECGTFGTDSFVSGLHLNSFQREQAESL